MFRAAILIFDIRPLVGPLARDLGVNPAHDRRAHLVRQKTFRSHDPKRCWAFVDHHMPPERQNRFSALAASLSPGDGIYLVGSFRFETLASNLTIGRTQPLLGDTKPFVHRSSSWCGGLIIFRKGELRTYFDFPSFPQRVIAHPTPVPKK